jgi:hypothetical protein
MHFYWLLMGVLCVWRVTHLLNAEDGPWDLLVRLRRWVGQGFFAKLLDCFYCLSLWISAPLAWLLGSGWKERLLLWPALSAGAILVERLTSHQEDGSSPSPTYFEDPEDRDVLLRQNEGTVSGGSAKSAS